MKKLVCKCGSKEFFSHLEIDYIECIKCNRQYRVFEKFLGNDFPVLERFKKEVWVRKNRKDKWEFYLHG